jgi:hypothetical protein
MYRLHIPWLLCAVMASSCVVTTKKEEPVVRDHRTAERPPPPPPRDHREPAPPPPRDHREPAPPPPRYEPRPDPRPPSWNSHGWTLIGEQWVDGHKDKDFIRPSRRQGPYTRLMLVVEEGDLRMGNIILTYDNGRKHSPRIDHQFREGDRTRPIDLKGDARYITEIELRYGNIPGGGRARVQIWGREGEATSGPVTPPPPTTPAPPPGGGWDSRGWTLLGQQSVQGGRDRDFVEVGARDGRFTKLMLVVEGSDLKMNDIIIEYDNGRKHSPKVRQVFKEGSRTRAIDLKGEARIIKRIELRYGNLPGGGQATVQVWGREG